MLKFEVRCSNLAYNTHKNTPIEFPYFNFKHETELSLL